MILNCLYIKVARLLYTNSGVGVLALGTNGVQKLWKWNRSEQSPSGKVIYALQTFIFDYALKYTCKSTYEGSCACLYI